MFVTFDDLGAVDELFASGTVGGLLDARITDGMKLVEADSFLRAAGVR